MSLIQEALKRKLEEKGGAGGGATPPPAPLALATPPPAPPPLAMPPGVTVQEAEPVRASGVKIAGMIGGIVVMVAVALVLILMAIKSWSHKQDAANQPAPAPKQIPAGTVTGTTPKPAPAAAASAPAEETTMAANPLASVQERVGDMKTKVLDSRREGSEITGDKVPVPEPAKPAPQAAAAPAPAPKPAAPASSTASSGSTVSPAGSQEFSLWPKITVNGILSKGSRGKGMAIINNQMMSVNETIDGVRLVEVRAQGALMEFGGESRFIEIGQTVQ